VTIFQNIHTSFAAHPEFFAQSFPEVKRRGLKPTTNYTVTSFKKYPQQLRCPPTILCPIFPEGKTAGA
jgi:hypothetical protein